MARSRKSENGMPPFDEGEFHEALATAMDQLEPMMGMPVAVRNQFLKNGFSETAAEQAAMAMWISMMGINNNGG